MRIGSLPPGLVLVLGAVLLLPLLRGRLRHAAVLTLPLLSLALAWALPDGVVLSARFLDYTIEPVKATTAGRLFATVFSIMAFGWGLYAFRLARTTELVAGYVLAGSAIGVTFAGDLITLFVFWELMAVGSAVVIWMGGTPAAYRAGMRYMLVHFLAGVAFMFGVASYVAETGSTAFQAMQPNSLATWLILAAFLVNAGAPPLSALIPDAYPEASPTGSVVLSCYTTKTAVYTLLVGFPGAWVLVPFGLYMCIYGVVWALLENDNRRILGYSLVNQVGFMVTGVGIGTPLALNGAAAHAFSHIIYKGLLFMSAGSVVYRTGRRKVSQLGGLARTMPITALGGIIGAISISGFPLTSGFISKPMVSQAAADLNLAVVWLLIAAATAGVFLDPGIKFPLPIFFQKDSGLRPPDAPWNMKAAMLFFSAICIGLGLFPRPLYEILPFPVGYQPYTADHVLAQLQLLLFGGLAYLATLPLMKPSESITLDFDWFYRRFGTYVARESSVRVAETWGSLMAAGRARVTGVIDGLFQAHGPQGGLARTWPTGSMVLWVAILLGAYLAFALL
ncbi:MAG: Na(+)/H(+) antiporter subunit D [Gemmatimonadetes bacterium]|nr:Na(+)/H(+) antiporter subunit D [Gemmatimonadota bacterium]